MERALLLCVVGAGLMLSLVDASSISSCSQHFSCMSFSEGGCSGGKRRVCLQQNSASSSSSCPLNDQNPPTTFNAICALANGTVRTSGTNIACFDYAAGTTAMFRADGGAAGSSSSSGSLLHLGNTVSRAASCATTGSRLCPGSVFNELVHTFTVSSCSCNCGGWASWSACVGTSGCTNLKRTRTRTCTAPAAAGDVSCQTSEEETCSSSSSCPACSCDANWSSWTSCSATCGGGTRTRRKSCRSNTVATCNDIVQSDTCGQSSCPDTSPFACLCGGWSSWASCSKTCGSGTTRRTRTCSPIAAVAGSSCPLNVFPLEQSKSCNDQSCGSTNPSGCSCGSWTNVGACVGTCGSGIQSRERICTNCPAAWPRIDTVSCNTGRVCSGNQACVCGPFFSSGCSVTCGFGFETRSRTCSSSCPVNKITTITVPCGTGNRCRRGGRGRGGRRRNNCRRLRTAAGRRRCRRRNRAI